MWLLGLLIFEYDKDNLVLDQVTREAVLPEGADGPQSSEDVFPNRESDEWIESSSINNIQWIMNDIINKSFSIYQFEILNQTL